MSPDAERRKAQEEWGYADAVISGDTIYLSGVIVGLREGGDPELAFTRAFERIGEILKRAGASWDDAVEMTSYHTDLQSQFPIMVRVKNRFVKPPAIAWTAVEVSRLIPDRGITEIKVVARRPSQAR